MKTMKKIAVDVENGWAGRLKGIILLILQLAFGRSLLPRIDELRHRDY